MVELEVDEEEEEEDFEAEFTLQGGSRGMLKVCQTRSSGAGILGASHGPPVL